MYMCPFTIILDTAFLSRICPADNQILDNQVTRHYLSKAGIRCQLNCEKQKDKQRLI